MSASRRKNKKAPLVNQGELYLSFVKLRRKSMDFADYDCCTSADSAKSTKSTERKRGAVSTAQDAGRAVPDRSLLNRGPREACFVGRYGKRRIASQKRERRDFSIGVLCFFRPYTTNARVDRRGVEDAAPYNIPLNKHSKNRWISRIIQRTLTLTVLFVRRCRGSAVES